MQIKIESAIKGKSDGITAPEQSESPRRIPSERLPLSKSKIIPSPPAQMAVKRLFLFKKSRFHKRIFAQLDRKTVI